MKWLIGFFLLLINSSCAFPGLFLYHKHIPGWYIWYGGFRFLFLLLILIGVIIFLVLRNRKREEEPTETPLDILKKRYASGDISREEFIKIKKDLKGKT